MANLKTRLLVSTALLIAGPLAAVGCGDEPPPAAVAPTSSPLTYSNDIAPILEAKCTKCHRDGGIGPFRLTTYDQARAMALPMAAATRAGTMPPYYITHDGTCGEFDDHEALSPEEIAAIDSWATGGQKEGDPLTRPRPAPLSVLEANAELKTPTITPVAQGGPLARNDEYRCFPMDSALDRDRFIVGYDVVPGNPAIVHHMEAFLVNTEQRNSEGKTAAEVLQALDDADPDRPGWPCFGSAADDLADQNIPIIWAPGQGPILFPEGMGVRQRKSDRLIIQIHYNLSHSGHGGHGTASSGSSDSTTLRLRYADSVEREAMVFPLDLFLETIQQPQPASLPPGMKSTRYTARITGTELGLGDVPYLDVVSIMPHMHGRGLRQEMRFRQPGEASQCTSKLDRWDFDWQKVYFYRGTRPRITPQTEIEISCEYDTSKDSEPVTPGWGTENEMCSAIMMIALPTGS
jgi:hypothetical protein